MPNIFVTRSIPDEGLSLLQSSGHTVTVFEEERTPTKEELITALKERAYDAVLCLLTDRIDGEVMDAAPSVKLFANYAVGFDNIDMSAAKERGITITNTPEVLTNAVAEHVFALLLSLVRRIVESDAYIREGKYTGWAPKLLLGSELKGKTLGLVGGGRIGSRVGVIARGFSMRVLYYDVKRNEAFEQDSGASFHESLPELLSEADVVSIHVPLLPSTRHLIDAKALAYMKSSACLINTSRGPVVDEAALVDALKNNRIAGAGLDVFEQEPALSEGLADFPNVVLTPHTASATIEARSAMSRVAAENILAFLKGETPPNKVEAS
jgi:lactate dehydrogenase-like 2-hydroxyacid dehydrogenase